MFSLLLDVFLWAVLPAALLAGLSLWASARWGGEKWAPIGFALGLALAAVVGWWLRGTLTLVSGISPWNRLPWLGLGTLAVGLGTHWPKAPWILTALSWIIRASYVGLAAWLVIPQSSQDVGWWLVPGFTLAVLALWAVLEPLARRPPDGGVLLAAALCLMAAAGVFIHAGSARLTDAATVLASALGGLAIVAWWRRLDGGPAVPALAFLLPGLLLLGQQSTYAELSWVAFVLPGTAPLLLAVTLPSASWPRRRLWLVRLALILPPLIAALALAMQAGGLEWE